MCSVYIELDPIFEMGLKVIKFDKNAKTKIISLGIPRIEFQPTLQEHTKIL